jgi:hypothetical protein
MYEAMDSLIIGLNIEIKMVVKDGRYKKKEASP